MKKIPTPLSLLLPFLLLFSCQQTPEVAEQNEGDQLGLINFKFSGNDQALPLFQKGLLLLHNFEYDDAREAFLEAQQADSTMLMAVWGEAMTYNHPLWREQEYEDAQAALQKIAATPEERAAKAKLPIEKDWLQAIEVLYGEGEKKERDQQYKAFMEGLYQKYPGDHEVAAFYALSCLGAGSARKAEAYEQGANIVKNIIKDNPQHPGALHYLIHSYDDPGHASLALNAANSYSKVAADAAHALHMPSHIYVAVGMWDEVVKSNIASWNASVNRMKAKELDGDARSYHAFHWWLYGLLQKGQYAEAAKIMQQMNGYISDESKKSSRTYLIRMKGNFLVETGLWNDSIAEYYTEMEDINIVGRSIYDYLEGVKAYRQKDMAQLTAVLEAMAKRRAFAETLVSGEGTPMCNAAGSNRFTPNRSDIDKAHVMEMELRALRNWTDQTEAEQWLKRAAELEESSSYVYGPPTIVQPSFELYGQWLLENKKAEEALQQFEKAIERGPKRVAALQGKIEALKALDRKEDAAKAQIELMLVLKDADEIVRSRYSGKGVLSSL